MTYQEYLASLGAHPGMTHMPVQPMGEKGAGFLDFMEQQRQSAGDAVEAAMQGDYEQFGGLLADAAEPARQH